MKNFIKRCKDFVGKFITSVKNLSKKNKIILSCSAALLVIVIAGGVTAGVLLNKNNDESNGYTVNFVTNDGGNIPSVTLAEGSVIALPENPQKLGYAFAGWFYDAALSQPFNPQAAISADTTLYADWLVSYSITYQLPQGAENDPQNPVAYTLASVNMTFAAPTREHYDFAGWYIGEVLVTALPEDSVGNLTLTSAWTPKSYSITYQLPDYAVNNPSNPSSYTVESGEIMLQPATKDYCVFVGWYDGETEVTSIPAGSTGNKTLQARFFTDKVVVYANNAPAYVYQISFNESSEEHELILIEALLSAETVVIPDQINGVPVVKIDTSVFENNTTLQSITLPATVREIGSYVFRGCSSLTDVDLNKTGALYQIGQGVFENCTALESLMLPQNLVLMGIDTFKNCTSLQDLYVENTVDGADTTPGSYWGATHGAEGMLDGCNIATLTIYVHKANGTYNVDSPDFPQQYNGVNVYKSMTYWTVYADCIQLHPDDLT